ncbi:MAG: hypothetical protein JRI23_17005 [Deltaproteobacteria bacterium]|jgi:hypothetical protein|nr:hypothetical protein [Deltaproteobacteria bacterium]MBW2533508.1 hypothetical protein [Deltaproteobacteria bacterium]
MNLPHRTTLSSALAIAILAAAPAALAQPEDPEEGTEEGAEGAEGEAAEAPAEPPPPPPDLGGWGVGGKEEEGRYKPRGKTGKLKEMESEEADDREEAEGPPILPPPGYAYLDTAIGFGETRVVVQRTGNTDITPTASFLIGLGYRIGDTWSVGARFPISTGENNGPIVPPPERERDPDAYKQIAIGGIEVAARPEFILNRTMRVPASLALVIPTQSGDMNADPDNRADIGMATVNQAAAASRGYVDRALFQHKRFGIVPGVGFTYDDGTLEAGAETKIEILIRTGGEDPQETPDNVAQVETRGAVANWVLGGRFFYGFFDGLLTPGLHLWLVAGSAADFTPAQDYSGALFVFEPWVKSDIPFTEDGMVGLNLGVGADIPAGTLGGTNEAAVYGLRIRTGLFF